VSTVGSAKGGIRELTAAVLACTVGAGGALIAATRDWAVEITPRPAPLSPLREVSTGATVAPWLPALGLVALAGTAALVATRESGRRVIGVFLIAVGLGIAVASGFGWAASAAEQSVVDSVVWPVMALAGGLLVSATGGFALVRGSGWPVMSRRYERPTSENTTVRSASSTELPDVDLSGFERLSDQVVIWGERKPTRTERPRQETQRRVGRPEEPGPSIPQDSAEFWDALDRGEDPTADPPSR